MDLRQAQAPRCRWLHLTTATICGVSIIVCFLAPCINAWIEDAVYKRQGLLADLPASAACGLALASPFAVLYVLSLLARRRLMPSGATLAGAVLAGGMAMLIFASYCGEAVEVWRTGGSPYRYTGNWRGSEFVFWPIAEWVFGMPAFLLLYGLGWLGSAWAAKKRGGEGWSRSGNGDIQGG